MSNILVKNPEDQLILLSLWTSVEPFLVGSSNKKVKTACGTVMSETQQPNFSLYCYYLFNFKAILCFKWSLHCTVIFAPKDTSPADQL